MAVEQHSRHGSPAGDDGPSKELASIKIQDEAGDLAARALMLSELDQESARKVRRKIDMPVLPFLCITYAVGRNPYSKPKSKNTQTQLLFS